MVLRPVARRRATRVYRYRSDKQSDHSTGQEHETGLYISGRLHSMGKCRRVSLRRGQFHSNSLYERSELLYVSV